MQSLGQILEDSARIYGDKTALIFKGQEFSYRDLNSLVNRMSNALRAVGVKKGDRVSLLFPNSVECIVAYHAVARAGAVINPLNVMFKGDEIKFIVNDCQVSTMITTRDQLDAIERIRGEMPSLERVVVTGEGEVKNALSYTELLEKGSSEFSCVSCEKDDLAMVAYSSGTTGTPKGVMLTHANMFHGACIPAMAHRLSKHDRILTALPVFHLFGGNVVMNACFVAGATLVLMDRFDPEEALSSIAQYRTNVFEGVPTMFAYLLGRADLARFDLSCLERCMVAGAPMPVKLIADFEDKFQTKIYEMWGMTEVAGILTANPMYGDVRPGSVGIPLMYTLARIAGDDDQGLPTGDVGELQVKAPTLMNGYWGLPEATAEALRGGWMHTGDLARMDEDGYIYIVDRKKDMIITGGYNIYPAEVERVISDHPAVAMVAVAGMPDDVKGEVAKAFVVLKSGAQSSPQQIIDFCRDRIAVFKVPRAVEFVDDLPKTSTGKVLRRALRQR